jgi:ribonuclease E
LAAELGVEVPEEPAAAPAPSREALPPEARAPETEGPKEGEPGVGETYAGAAEKLAEGAVAEEGRLAEKRPGRRRRKRRRRVPAPIETEEITAAEEAVELAEEGEAAAEELIEVVPAEGETAAISARRPEEEAPGARPKRRRRRGGRKREDAAREGEREGETVQAGAAAVSREATPSVEGEEMEDEEADEDREFLHHEAIHRGIPTWEEAVGLVIAANMEARAKRPGGPPRPRGGQRGGRDKPAEK